MLTDSPRRQATAEPVTLRLNRAMRQFICGLHGHDSLLHFEQGRMSLECTSCGYESPGWDLSPHVPAPQPPRARDLAPRLPVLAQRLTQHLPPRLHPRRAA